ncbi:hypothetical protein Anas_04968 [Armadillidium nasatum]|uniref:CHK kinase-like domain-containing protein n=1 Tax=Armadillidium nasatum TaxID=96803 RepID=A0A5N5T0W7_9CRUS|nr:hypothetical protein Anas_04968 [Armadillidium nasatum]
MSEVQVSAPLKSYELVSNELVTDALKNDKGPNVELLSWEIKPFTNKGDNYSSIVVGITVSYRKNEMNSECSYVAKLNPLRPLNSNTENFEKAYTRETEVLDGIVEGMNNQLKQLGFDAIKTPKLLSKNLEKGREAFVTENLRTQGFKMCDKMRGMDLNHSLFVVKELGRFHASSLLFEETLPTKYIPDTFNGVKGGWLDADEKAIEEMGKFYSSITKPIESFLKTSDPKYEKCCNWLSKNSHTLAKTFLNGMQLSNQFEVLIHGDCWSNNMLFRYNEDGIPIDFRFVDLQCSGKSSATTDLNYFFFTSLNGDFPQGEDVPDMDNMTDDRMDEFIDKQARKFEEMSGREGPFSDRYIAIFDDMLDTDIFDAD